MSLHPAARGDRPVGYYAQRAMVADLFASTEAPPPITGWSVRDVVSMTALSESRARDILNDLTLAGLAFVVKGVPRRWTAAL